MLKHLIFSDPCPILAVRAEPMHNKPFPRGDIAGILFGERLDVDAVLVSVTDSLRSKGIRVSGLLQHFGAPTPAGKRSMYVEDIASGERVRLDIPRGPGASGCSLDPNSLARAACMLRVAIRSRPDVLIVNRFGHEEAEGRGLRPELAEAVCAGLLTLVAVSHSLLSEWAEFVGEAGHILPPNPGAIVGWVCERAQAGSAKPSPAKADS